MVAPDLFMVVVAGVAFALVLAIGLVLIPSGAGPGSKRLAVVSRSGARPQERPRAGVPDAAGRRKQILQNLKSSEQRAKMTLSSRLQQAGLTMSVRTFWLVGLALGLVVALVAFVAAHNVLLGLGAGFVAGGGLPRWVLTSLRKSRHKKFTAEFPNSIDIIVRGIKSGLPVRECLKVIAVESPEPLGSEFQKLNDNLGIGLTIDEGMEKMFNRMPTSEVRFFAIVLAIQQKSGGNLAEALNNLSTVLRSRKLMVEKIKAMSGEAVASACIIGVLPPGLMILVTLTAPDYMRSLYVTQGGQMALLVGATMMAMGVFVMRKMISFKF